MTRFSLLLLALLASPVLATSISCDKPGYPKDSSEPIRYNVEKSFPKFAKPDDPPTGIRYYVFVRPRTEDQDFERAYADVLGDDGAAMISVPLHVQKYPVPDWKGFLVAWIDVLPGARPVQVRTLYGEACQITLRQSLLHDHVEGKAR